MKMIVAVDRSNCIGWQDGRLAFKSKVDMARFKSLTSWQTVVMGRKTFESIGKPLPNRLNVVATSGQINASVSVINDLEDWYHTNSVKNAWLIGGAQLYDTALDCGIVSELYVTVFDTNTGADVKLKHDIANWRQFVLHERTRGRNWLLTSSTYVMDNDIDICFNVLVKVDNDNKPFGKIF